MDSWISNPEAPPNLTLTDSLAYRSHFRPHWRNSGGNGEPIVLVAQLTPRKNGAPEEIRTPDPQIRSLVLYPAELRARNHMNHAVG